tara:strand:- start:1126 stop:1704 length:579 start_codon:yes stop_codon:yes gene_type:complete
MTNVRLNYTLFFCENPKLLVELNDKKYENTVGFNTGSTGGYYKNGYTVLEGCFNIYLKIYTVIHGIVEIEEEYSIDRATDKVIKYTGFNNTNLLPLVNKGEIDRNLMRLVSRQMDSIIKDYEGTNLLKGLITKVKEDLLDGVNEDDDSEEDNDSEDELAQMVDVWARENGYEACVGLCEECNKMDEACLCDY